MEAIIITLLGACGAGLLGIAGWLKSYIAKSTTLHEKCEADKDSLEVRVAKTEQDLFVFKTCDTDGCGARKAFQRAQTFSLHPHKDEPPKVPQ